MITRIILPPKIQRLMKEHADLVDPEECCGLLVGIISESTSTFIAKVCYPMLNTAMHKEDGYVLWPEAAEHIWEEGIPASLEPVAFYHSHPRTELYPSGVDTKFCTYPELAYLICDSRQIQAYRIDDNEKITVMEVLDK